MLVNKLNLVVVNRFGQNIDRAHMYLRYVNAGVSSITKGIWGPMEIRLHSSSARKEYADDICD